MLDTKYNILAREKNKKIFNTKSRAEQFKTKTKTTPVMGEKKRAYEGRCVETANALFILYFYSFCCC